MEKEPNLIEALDFYYQNGFKNFPDSAHDRLDFMKDMMRIAVLRAFRVEMNVLVGRITQAEDQKKVRDLEDALNGYRQLINAAAVKFVEEDLVYELLNAQCEREAKARMKNLSQN